jgi:cell division protein FtsA
MMRPHIAVGLDVGTTKVCAVVAEVCSGRADRQVNLLGLGFSPSAGLKKGVVINVDATVDSIRKAVREAEASCGARIKSVSICISGGHIEGFDSSGAVGIRGKEVSAADVERSIDSAKAVYIPLDREVLHVIPTGFVLDGQKGITHPTGMSGVRLEAEVHIITGAASPVQNLMKCCEKAGLEVADLVFAPLASAHAVLTGEEWESGAILIDIGGGTTDVALFKDGSLRYASVIGVGGHHFTNDIAVGLRISLKDAEGLKKTSGAAYEGLVSREEEIKITQSGGTVRTLPRRYVAEILQPRAEELLHLIKTEIKKCSGYGTAICGIVATGGGSRLGGFDKLAESVLGLPVRTGFPVRMEGLNDAVKSPACSAGAGLVAYACESEAKGIVTADLVGGAFGRVKDWFQDRLKYADYFNFINRKEGGVLCLKSRK